jgi:glycosyltransferase involved in cell wall biosynthesis
VAHAKVENSGKTHLTEGVIGHEEIEVHGGADNFLYQVGFFSRKKVMCLNLKAESVGHNPLVSVIIPSKNRHDLVVVTLGSVINQTYDNIEIIVVDDGSDVPLTTVLEEKFSAKVLCLRNERSLGGAAARNRGARNANGEFIAFLDDDDQWLPEKLANQVAAFRNLGADIGVVYCGFDFLLHDQVVRHRNCYHTAIDLRIDALMGCPVGSPTPLIRKIYFDVVGGFDSALPSCQDWDLWIRLSKVCKFYPIRESLALYRIHGQQISTDIHKKIEGRKILLAKHSEDIKKHPRLLSAHYSRIGSLYILVNNDSEARKFFIRSLSSNIFNVGALVHLILQLLCRPLEKWLIERCSTNTIHGIKVIH